jgi:hypothetical protein
MGMAIASGIGLGEFWVRKILDWSNLLFTFYGVDHYWVRLFYYRLEVIGDNVRKVWSMG